MKGKQGLSLFGDDMTDFPQTDAFIQTLSQELGVQEQNGFPWMPLPQEDAASYMAFELWRDMGPRRPQQQHLMAQQHHWGARALAYDAWLKGQPQDIKLMADQIAKTIMKSAGTALDALQVELIKILRQLGTTGIPSMTLPELMKSLETIAKTSRLLADRSTENVAVVAGTVDLTKLPAEDLDEMERLLKKASTELTG